MWSYPLYQAEKQAVVYIFSSCVFVCKNTKNIFLNLKKSLFLHIHVKQANRTHKYLFLKLITQQQKNAKKISKKLIEETKF